LGVCQKVRSGKRNSQICESRKNHHFFPPITIPLNHSNVHNFVNAFGKTFVVSLLQSDSPSSMQTLPLQYSKASFCTISEPFAQRFMVLPMHAVVRLEKLGQQSRTFHDFCDDQGSKPNCKKETVWITIWHNEHQPSQEVKKSNNSIGIRNLKVVRLEIALSFFHKLPNKFPECRHPDKLLSNSAQLQEHKTWSNIVIHGSYLR
jgi:hypothetical protein